MKGDLQHHCQAPELSTDPILFGGFDPVTDALRLTVEASTAEVAQLRMLAVAPLIELEMVQHFSVRVLEKPSLTVPLFMEGYFQATRMSMTGASSASASASASGLGI